MSNDQLQTLLTQTPEDGYALAVKLAQKGVEVTQPSEEIRKLLRPVYSRDTDSLIAASQVIAIHFQTIAAANNYWRTWTPQYY
ncbi:hexameric tyrosine-coordinated heme protein [Sporosarcina koreensis]|uniref:Hexameric tyrosine-coordinated heme protein n=1 Tax=Sporosarcina koreensis TaxID=334735 RepID=A0ABW0TUU0_9BACL